MNSLLVLLLRPFLPRRRWYREYYLQTYHWYNKARRIRRLAGYKCQNCGKPKPLDVHHRWDFAYWFLFLEADWMLQALCRECHDEEHERN